MPSILDPNFAPRVSPEPIMGLSNLDAANSAESVLDQTGHLAIVKEAVTRPLDRPDRRDLYEYTYTYITEADLRADGLLSIADVATGDAFDRMKKYPWPCSPRHEDRAAFFEAKTVAEDILDHAELVSDLFIGRGSRLVGLLGSVQYQEETASLARLEAAYDLEVAQREQRREEQRKKKLLAKEENRHGPVTEADREYSTSLLTGVQRLCRELFRTA